MKDPNFASINILPNFLKDIHAKICRNKIF